jgi:hypothetical protein
VKRAIEFILDVGHDGADAPGFADRRAAAAELGPALGRAVDLTAVGGEPDTDEDGGRTSPSDDDEPRQPKAGSAV